MTDTNTPPLDLESLCALAHDVYEAEAVRVGWRTQDASRVPWSRLPEANKLAMRAAISAVLASRIPPDAGEDTARLDWLSARLSTRADVALWLFAGAPASTPPERDLRAAIDAARECTWKEK